MSTLEVCAVERVDGSNTVDMLIVGTCRPDSCRKKRGSFLFLSRRVGKEGKGEALTLRQTTNPLSSTSSTPLYTSYSSNGSTTFSAPTTDDALDFGVDPSRSLSSITLLSNGLALLSTTSFPSSGLFLFMPLLLLCAFPFPDCICSDVPINLRN